MANTTLDEIVESYILSRELKPRSVRQIKAHANIFLKHYQIDDMPAEDFTVESLNRFLAAKFEQGKACHYRRSLRNTLKALLAFANHGTCPGKVRPVKLTPLEPDSWTPAEVKRLIEACDLVKFTRWEWHYWRTKIAAGYYTGLNAIDLERVRRIDITDDGTLPFQRAKTGAKVVVRIPLEVLAEIGEFHRGDGAIWRTEMTEEGHRLVFKRIVRLAGLSGTFKKLRKTCGTQVELHHPGRGHEQLGHDRDIFEDHYGDRKKLAKPPVMPPLLSPAAVLSPNAQVGIEAIEWI